jgi:hypothetical protein
MKAINITGTTSEVFRIGEGTNAVDLRVIEGKLYFKNFGDAYKELLSSDATITLSPISWASNTYYSEGDLIYYNENLFQVIGNHTSESFFINTNDYYRRITNINTLTKVDVSLYKDNPFQLDLLSSNFVHLYGLGTGNFYLKMPEPTQISVGSQYTIQNNSSKIINVYTSSNALITIINPNENKILVFLEYITAPIWTSLSVAGDQINFGLEVKKIIFQNNQSYKFIGASGIFPIDKAGKYSFFDNFDANLNGDIYWVTGGGDCKIITFSDKIVSGDTLSYFCIFNINNDLYLKNRTGINREIVFHSLYQQGI